MASRNVRENGFIPPASSDSEISLVHHGIKRRKRDASVYDAVAGRVTTTLPLLDDTYQRTTLRDATLAPEEVLFRRAGAPVRYAEKDIYHAHERLPDAGSDVLPDSDMLKAIHRYSSHFYAALAAGKTSSDKSTDEQSMDETALLAFGILLEEATRQVLGKKGDLVLTEGVEADGEGGAGTRNSEAVGFLDVERSRRDPRTPRSNAES